MTPLVFNPRAARRACAALVLAGLPLGCSRAAKPPEEKVPPAPVKWEAARQLFLEEWTELVGTTLPLPDRAARVTAPVEGRVVSLLLDAGGRAVAEGQAVKEGDVLARLDATVPQAARDKAASAKKVLLAEKEAAEFAVKAAGLEVKRLNDLRRQQGSQSLVPPIELEKASVALESAQAHARADDRKLE